MAHSNQLLNQVLDQLESQADTERQDDQEKRLSMYLDDYSDRVDDLLKSQFHKDNYDRLFKLLATYYNLFKKVVNLKSVIYKKEAIRQWTKRKGDKQDDRYNELINQSNVNVVMPTANKLTNVNNTSFVRVMSMIDQNTIMYQPVASENISIIQNPENPSEIRALLHRVVIKDSNTSIENIRALTDHPINVDTDDRFIIKYFYWDKDTYIVLDGDQNILRDQVFVNPYKDKTGQGIIPYVLFSNMQSVDGSIWNETVNSDLYDGTLQVNVFQTYQNNLMKTAGYKQAAISGLDEKEVKKLNEKVSDPLQPLVFTNPETKIDSFELSTKLGEFQGIIHDIISEIADNHGVEFSSRTSSAQKMSGLALSISQEAINNIREEQHPFYRQAETELAKKTVIVANKDLKSPSIDIEGNFSIDFFQEQEQISTKDKIEQDKFYLSKNLKSIVDLYREIDKDCPSDKEAIARMKKNEEQNQELLLSDPFIIPDDDDDKNKGKNGQD